MHKIYKNMTIQFGWKMNFWWRKMTFIVSAHFSYDSTSFRFSSVKLIIVMKLSASNVI